MITYVISGHIIKTTQGYAKLNFEDTSLSTFGDIPKRSFCDGEVSDGSGSMNAICSRPEVADDVISGMDVKTLRYYACVNVWVAIFRSFRENLNQPFV